MALLKEKKKEKCRRQERGARTLSVLACVKENQKRKKKGGVMSVYEERESLTTEGS